MADPIRHSGRVNVTDKRAGLRSIGSEQLTPKRTLRGVANSEFKRHRFVISFFRTSGSQLLRVHWCPFVVSVPFSGAYSLQIALRTSNFALGDRSRSFTNIHAVPEGGRGCSRSHSFYDLPPSSTLFCVGGASRIPCFLRIP